MGRPHLICQGLNRTNRLMSKKVLWLPNCLELGHWSLPASQGMLAPAGSQACQLWDWNHPMGSPRSSACQLQILELVCLHNHVSQFLLVNTRPYLSLENPNTATNSRPHRGPTGNPEEDALGLSLPRDGEAEAFIL